MGVMPKLDHIYKKSRKYIMRKTIKPGKNMYSFIWIPQQLEGPTNNEGENVLSLKLLIKDTLKVKAKG